MIALHHILSQETPLYGGNGLLELKQICSISDDDTSNNTELSFPAHSGTHIDAPYHFDPEGLSLDRFHPDFLLCKSPFLIEYSAQPGEIITLTSLLPLLQKIPVGTDLLLIRSGMETLRRSDPGSYIFHGAGLVPEIGLWLRKNRKLKMIGFDWISLTCYENRSLGRDAHKAFLSSVINGIKNTNPVLIIEDMKLSDAPTALMNVLVSPLLYWQADGSPVSVWGNLE
jgi:kynurenine formamidase